MIDPFDAIIAELIRVRREMLTVSERDPELHITVTQEFRMKCLDHPTCMQRMESMCDGYRQSTIMGVPFTVVMGHNQAEPFLVWRRP